MIHTAQNAEMIQIVQLAKVVEQLMVISNSALIDAQIIKIAPHSPKQNHANKIFLVLPFLIVLNAIQLQDVPIVCIMDFVMKLRRVVMMAINSFNSRITISNNLFSVP